MGWGLDFLSLFLSLYVTQILLYVSLMACKQNYYYYYFLKINDSELCVFFFLCSWFVSPNCAVWLVGLVVALLFFLECGTEK